MDAIAHAPWYYKLLAVVLTVLVAFGLRLVLGIVITRVSRRIGESRMPQWKVFPGRSAALLSERRDQRTQTAASLLNSIASFLLFLTAVILILGYLDVELTKVFAGVGVLSLIVGFGAREIISDFLTGIAMLSADQYGVGDVVDVGSVPGTIVGTVEAVGLRTTRLRDADGSVWYVRNGQIARVGNFSQGWGRAVIDVPVPADRDPDDVREVLAGMASSMRDEPPWQSVILDEPDVAGIVELGTDHYVVQVTVRTSPLREQEVAAELRERFRDVLDTENAGAGAGTGEGTPAESA
ncbi:MAG: mechanosensitive ion channel [Streptosporangiales bacterium]|nr:mechanosensitive ion channel [Streptosporangiales bacterium]